MPEEVNPNTPVSTTPQTKPPVNWKLIGIISVASAIIIGGLGYAAIVLNVFDKKEAAESPNNVATNSSNPNNTMPTKKKSLPNEKWIIGDCTKEVCSLFQVSTSGAVSTYPNKYNFKKDTQVLFSIEGENIVYVEGDQIVIVDLVNETDKKIAAKGVKLIKVVPNSFWVEDNGVYKLYDYSGKVKFNFNKSGLKPKNGFDSVDLSSYSGGSALILLSKGVEGGIFRELWSVTQNQEPKKVMDLHFNVGSETWDLGSLIFFNNEAALLATTTSDKIPYYTPYKIFLSGQRTKLFEVAETTFSSPQLNSNDSVLYYSGEEGLYEPSSLSGVYKVDLPSGKITQIIKGNNYNASDQSFDSYHLRNISPSGKYIALFDAIVSAKKSTTYTPAILSLNDSSLDKAVGHTGGVYDTRKSFGWIKSE